MTVSTVMITGITAFTIGFLMSKLMDWRDSEIYAYHNKRLAKRVSEQRKQLKLLNKVIVECRTSKLTAYKRGVKRGRKQND